MLKMMRQELQNAMSMNMPLAALVDALSLLDGISKVEYPDDKQSARYVKWWDNFAKGNSYLDGETVYQVRCFIMHETKMAIHSKSFEILALSVPDDCEKRSANTVGIMPDGKNYYRVDLYDLCVRVCNAFDSYYRDNKNKVDLADLELMVTTESDLNKWKSGEITQDDIVADIMRLKDAGLLKKTLGEE